MQTHNTANGESRELVVGNVGKVVVGSCVAFGIWMGATTYTSSVRLSVIETKVDTISSAAQHRYTSKDADADQRNIANQFKDLDRRLTRVEVKLGGASGD